MKGKAIKNINLAYVNDINVVDIQRYVAGAGVESTTVADSQAACRADAEANAIVGALAVTRYGVNGDPLKEGKLDLSELLEQPTPDEWAGARYFIVQRSWREAVTYRETAPHEYVVRKWEVDPQGSGDFDRFVTLIRRFGYADFYYRVRHIYWAIDEFKYWTMGWPVEETTVINRARVDAPEPWKES